MHKALDKSEIEQLGQFRFATDNESSELSIELYSLIDDTVMIRYLENLGPHIGSPNLRVTSSIFVKRYAFLAVIYLYVLTAWNKKLDVSFNNLIIQTKKEEDMWLPTFYFRSILVQEATEDRNEWREEALKEFFSENIHILLDQLSKVTKQSRVILWENISLYIFWLYEIVLIKSEDDQLLNRAIQDFYFIVHEAPGSLFGNYPNNPINQFYVNKRYIDYSQDEVRVRKTCCLSYSLMGKQKYCKSCPLICNKYK